MGELEAGVVGGRAEVDEDGAITAVGVVASTHMPVLLGLFPR